MNVDELGREKTRKRDSVLEAASLLKAISKLEKRLLNAIGDPARIDRVRGFGGEDTPYADFTPKLEPLFDRCRTAFNLDRLELAREAYAGLFTVLAVKDVYGFAVVPPAATDMRMEYYRFLRAVVETAPAKRRAQRLLDAMRDLRQRHWDACDLSILGVLEITPSPLADRAALLDDLIRLLGKGTENDDDRWLRQAVRLRRGAEGLAELARKEGQWRPRVWVDWLELVAAENDPAKLGAAAKEALGGIPEGLNLRATTADHWFRAATALSDGAAALTARWEAFRAEPFPCRLLDLRDAAGDASARLYWMKRAVDQTLCVGTPLVQGPEIGFTGRDEDRPFLEEGDRFDDAASEGMTACAQLLAGDWRGAFEKAREEPVRDWSSGYDTQGFVLPVLLAWLAGRPENPSPPNLAVLLDESLQRLDMREEPEPRTSRRFGRALAEAMAEWQAPTEAEQSKLLNDCVGLALQQVNAIANGTQRDACGRAATLACAVVELLRARGDARRAKRVVADLRTRHNRNSAFKKELARCRRHGVR